MRASPITRPSRPSIGITCSQRKCPGSSDRNAGMKTISHKTPRVFATGDCTFRDRNQRAPSISGKTGSRNAPIPNVCRQRSEITAPTIPIQLRAPRAVVKTEALLNEGSSGEYEEIARNRRSAETHSKKPINSFNRRLLVGLKMREKAFIEAYSAPVAAFGDEAAASVRSAPEPYDYAKNVGRRQRRNPARNRPPVSS